MAHAEGAEEVATGAIEKVANAGCVEAGECQRNLSWAAGLEEARGNPRKAMALYRRAYESAPDSDLPLESVARIAAGLSLYAEAADDYAILARRHPEDTRWTAAAEAQRRAAIGEAVRQ